MENTYFKPDGWRSIGERVDGDTALKILAEHQDELAIGPCDLPSFVRSVVLIVSPYLGGWAILGSDNIQLAFVNKHIYAPEVVLATAREILNEMLTHKHELVLS